MEINGKQKITVEDVCKEVLNPIKEIAIILFKGSYSLGGKPGFLAGLCCSIAYNVIFSKSNRFVNDVVTGMGIGGAVGMLCASFIISKKITFGFIGTTALIWFISFKIFGGY